MMTTLLTTILSDQEQEQEQQHHQQEKQINNKQRDEGGEGENTLLYHSIPESGNALNVGYNTNDNPTLIPNNDSNTNTNKRVTTTATSNNNNNDHLQTQYSGSYVTAMEQEQNERSNQHQRQQQHQQPFETDNNGDSNNSNDNGISSSESFVDTLKQAASNTTNSVIWWTMSHTSQRRKVFVQACYLGIGAIFGTLLRLILAQLFGQACSNPGTIGYINDEAVLCVTSNGETTQNEGIIFADLPANLLGSFIMGLLQDGTSLGLAINMPIAFVKPTNIFQSYDIWHLALKTGFCGSLTTFSAWNSEMVILLVGNHTGGMSNRPSMVWKALFGYVIGIETAIGSYVFGRTVAWWFHRWMNPQLASEQREMNIREKKHGIVINRTLPILERQYLHGLFENNGNNNNNSSNINDNGSNGASNSLSASASSSYALSPTSTLTQEEIEPLYRWRESTLIARRVESGDEINRKLVELETSLIVRKESITHEQLDTALYYDWDIDALQNWLTKRNKYYNHQDINESSSSLPSSSSVPVPVSISLTPAGISKTMSEDDTVWYAAPVAFMLLMLCLIILINLMLYWDGKTSYDITYRTMAYSMLFAPPGALLRWKLSGWNGQLGSSLIPIPRLVRWKWLPVGTLAANALGAMISISMIGWEYNIGAAGSSGGFTSSSFWGIATIRAIKIGFSGCLSTVSTFVSEVHKLTQIRQDRGYKYILITLVLSAVSAMILFIIIV